MGRNCDGHGGCPSQQQQHLGCRQCTDGEANQQRLGFQDKAAEAGASPSQRTRPALLHSSLEMLVREWGKLGSAIRRAAAVCLAPSAGADEDDELDLPSYVQLDKVTVARAVSSREAFGPLYLVT